MIEGQLALGDERTVLTTKDTIEPVAHDDTWLRRVLIRLLRSVDDLAYRLRMQLIRWSEDLI